jgi:hypothetical protein
MDVNVWSVQDKGCYNTQMRIGIAAAALALHFHYFLSRRILKRLDRKSGSYVPISVKDYEKKRERPLMTWIGEGHRCRIINTKVAKDYAHQKALKATICEEEEPHNTEWITGRGSFATVSASQSIARTTNRQATSSTPIVYDH